MEAQNTIPDTGADAGKITFTPKNYFKPNTPKGIQVVGDIMLIAGGIAGAILLFPLDAIIPAYAIGATTICAKIVAVTGIGGKILAKWGGYKPSKVAENINGAISDIKDDVQAVENSNATPQQ